MNVFISGQRAFGEQVYELVDQLGHRIVGVSSPPFRGNGDMDRLRAAAVRAGVAWMPSGSLDHRALPAGVDVILAAHSHDFIGRRTRYATTHGALGYHPSLLPLHRGRDAVEWTIRFRERIAGGSVYWLDDTVDGGPVAAQDWCFVHPTDTAQDLWRRDLMPIGLRLFERVLRDLEAGRVARVVQDERLATFEPAIDRPRLARPDLFELTDGKLVGPIVDTHPNAVHDAGYRSNAAPLISPVGRPAEPNSPPAKADAETLDAVARGDDRVGRRVERVDASAQRIIGVAQRAE